MYYLTTGLTSAEVAERIRSIDGHYFNLRVPNPSGPLEETDKLLEVGYIVVCTDGIHILSYDGSLKPYQ